MTLQSPKSLNSVRKKVREKKGIKNVRLGMPKYKFRQPCVECGELSRNGSRCEKHQRKIDGERDAVRNARKKLTGQYSGDYQKRAREVREAAERCWLCGEGPRRNDPWQADHVVPGDPYSPLLPAHRSCNASRGNRV